MNSDFSAPPERLAQWQIDVAALAGSLVHEIKNPLSTLHINTQLLLEEWQDTDTPREQRTVKRLKVMLSELKRLEGTINSFLTFAQKHELRLQEGSIHDVVNSVIDLIGEAADMKGIQIRTSLAPDVPVFRFDPALIRQTVMNILKNAMEAMPDGGELIVKSRYDPPWVAVDIIDTGCGIPEHQIGRVFDLYFSTKERGSGLGLATCRRIIQEHGGDMIVRSEEKKGSQFTFRLPLKPGFGES